MFDQLVVSGKMRKTTKLWAVTLSAILQLAILGVLLLIPQTYTEALPRRMLSTFLVAAKPAAAESLAQARPSPRAVVREAQIFKIVDVKKMAFPAALRKNLAVANEEAPAVDMDFSDGVAGGAQYDLAALIGSGSIAPPAPSVGEPRRIRVGGNVQAATLINQVMPQYPMIARTAHVSGTVVLHAVVGKDGTIKELEYVSGPPLLMKSAMDAVKEWRYRPALLNGEPVEVDTTINVVFHLVVR